MTRQQIKKIFTDCNSWSQIKTIFSNYAIYLKPERVTYNDSPLGKNAIIVFVVRCNERIDVNENPDFNNDLLVVAEYISDDNYNLFTFNVTADPKAWKPNIAHLCEQVYTGNIGLHRAIAGRIAIRSDKGLWYKRTDSNGNVIEETFGQIGVNIHDNGGFLNSSLGCVILESSSEYKNVFKPLLARASNKNNVPVAVINYDYWE